MTTVEKRQFIRQFFMKMDDLTFFFWHFCIFFLLATDLVTFYTLLSENKEKSILNDKNWVRSKTLTDKNIFICRILLVTTRTKVICLKWSDWINLCLRLRLLMIKKEPLLFYLIQKCQVCKKSTIFGKDETPCNTVNLFKLRPLEEIGVKLFIML